MPKLVLYTTLGCHLCELAAQLLTLPQFASLEVEPVEISEDDALVERYGIRIPVVADTGSGQELGWPFDAEQLGHFLSQLPGIAVEEGQA